MTSRTSPIAPSIESVLRNVCLPGSLSLSDMIDTIDESIALHAQILDALQPNVPARLEVRWRRAACCMGREPCVVKLGGRNGDHSAELEPLSDQFFPLRRERGGPFARTSRSVGMVLFKLQTLLRMRAAIAAAAKAASTNGRRSRAHECVQPPRASITFAPVEQQVQTRRQTRHEKKCARR